MPFLVRYSTDFPETTWQIDILIPGPTEVEYPDTREHNIQKTEDGAVVIQRPLRDSRMRSWSWVGYRPTVPNYENLFASLKSLEARQRQIDGLNPVIQIWENESVGEGGFDQTIDDLDPDLIGYTNIEWVQVKFTQVHRKSQKGGGLVKYDNTFVEFYVEEPSWENF
jgi:hypothetical protein